MTQSQNGPLMTQIYIWITPFFMEVQKDQYESQLNIIGLVFLKQ